MSLSLVVGAPRPGAPPVGEPPAAAVVVPMKDSGGHASIEIRINGKGPYRFLFDTGSGADLIVDQELAIELGLKSTGTRRLGDPNTPEAIEAQVVKVDRVDVGGLTLREVDAISWKREYKGMADFPRGVIGLGLFGPRLVTLDYGRGELTVESGALPEPDGRSVLASSFADGIPSIPIDVAGVAFRAHIDSGSSGFLGLPLDAAKTLPLEAPPVQVGRARTASGDYAVLESKLQGAVHLGGISIENPKVRFSGLPQANLGFDLIRSLVVTVDRANARVRLVSNGKPLEPTERPRLGIKALGPEDGRLPVGEVVPGSPAEAAGIRAGDKIERLNGRAVSEMSGPELGLAMMARPLTITLLRDGATVEVTVAAKGAANP
jgi:predicted aspartyl protease